MLLYSQDIIEIFTLGTLYTFTIVITVNLSSGSLKTTRSNSVVVQSIPEGHRSKRHDAIYANEEGTKDELICQSSPVALDRLDCTKCGSTFILPRRLNYCGIGYSSKMITTPAGHNSRLDSTN
ncbi:hypothetical protein TNCV_4460531 [Trichonephila clavipes]|nr:hypothetical protein TNCV_4460531 [Trichonephila clavipes]